MKLKYILILLLSIGMWSCSTSRSSLTYFEDIKTQTDGTLPAPSTYEIRIVPDDELLITVTSLIPEVTAEYNLPLSNPAKNGSLLEVTQPKQQTYLVDKAGDINFPRLGVIHVAGMTTSELQNLIAKKISVDVEDPIVKVALVNFRVNVLGEVRNPGTTGATYYYLQQNDAIYVEPNKIRKDNSKYNQNNAFKLSMASAIISASSVIASLVIALTVK